MLSTILRFLLLLFVFRLLFRFVAGLLSGYRASTPEHAAPAAGVALVRDRVCNTFVPRDKALSAVIAGQEEHFCSPDCRAKALASSDAARVDGVV